MKNTKKLDTTFTEFKASDFYLEILDYASTLTEQEIHIMTTKESSSVIKIQKIKKPRSDDGSTHKVVLRHRGRTHTMYFTSKTIALAFKNEMLNALSCAQPAVTRGRVRAEISSADKPHLEVAISALWPDYLIYIQEQIRNKQNNAKAFYIGFEKYQAELIKKNNDKSKPYIKLKSLYNHEDFDDIFKGSLKHYLKNSKSVKAINFLEFFEIDLFNNFHVFLKSFFESRYKQAKNLKEKREKELKDATSDKEKRDASEKLKKANGTFNSAKAEYEAMYDHGFFNNIFKEKVQKRVKEERKPVDKKPDVYADEVDVDVYYNQVEAVLLNSNNVNEIQFCLYAILNSFLGLRQGEMNAVRVEDVFYEQNKLIARHSISDKAGGYKYEFFRTKNGQGVEYHKNLGELELTTITCLLNPLFAADLSTYYQRHLKDGKLKLHRIGDFKGTTFDLEGKTLGQWLFDGGFVEISDYIEKQKVPLKRVLLFEGLQNQPSKNANNKTGVFVSPNGTRIKMRKLSEENGIPYITPHTRFRKGIATKINEMYGPKATQAFMGWGSFEMVGTYLAKAIEMRRSSSTAIGITSNLVSKPKEDSNEITRESVLERLSNGAKFDELSDEEKKLL